MQDHNTPVPATMGPKIIVIVFLALIQAEGCSARTKKIETRYDPTWESLDSRPLPTCYDEAKVGIFVSWGLFSVPSFGDEWFWERWQGDKNPKYVQYMQDNYKPDFTYADFASDFTAEFYDAGAWAELFAAFGAKYIVYISKYCDGFSTWATNVSFKWKSMMVGPKRDLVGEMAQALKLKTDLHLGLYHCLEGWFYPLYLQDKANNFTTSKFVTELFIDGLAMGNAQITTELYELVNNYKPDIVWSDGDQEAPDTYWGSKEFLAWLYYDSCSFLHAKGVLQPGKWKNSMTIDKKSWRFRREAVLDDYLTLKEIIAILVETVWYMQRAGIVYAIVLNWPQPGQLHQGSALPNNGTQVSLLGYTGSFSWQYASPKGISITIPPIPVNEMPCQWGWVFALT